MAGLWSSYCHDLTILQPLQVISIPCPWTKSRRLVDDLEQRREIIAEGRMFEFFSLLFLFTNTWPSCKAKVPNKKGTHKTVNTILERLWAKKTRQYFQRFKPWSNFFGSL